MFYWRIFVFNVVIQHRAPVERMRMRSRHTGGTRERLLEGGSVKFGASGFYLCVPGCYILFYDLTVK